GAGARQGYLRTGRERPLVGRPLPFALEARRVQDHHGAPDPIGTDPHAGTENRLLPATASGRDAAQLQAAARGEGGLRTPGGSPAGPGWAGGKGAGSPDTRREGGLQEGHRDREGAENRGTPQAAAGL